MKILLGFTALFLYAGGFCAGVDNQIWFSSKFSFEKGLPADKGTKNYFNSASNYLFLSSSAALTPYLGAEGIFSAGTYRFQTPLQSDSRINAAVNMLAARLKTGGFLFEIGRIFYGSKNTLMPYYGLYDNYFGVNSSALDGGYGSADFGKYFNLSAVYGRETEDYFSDGEGTLAGAVLSARPAAGVELAPFAYNFKTTNSAQMYKRNLRLYGAYLDFNLNGRASLYISYAANKGKDDYFYNLIFSPGAYDYNGDAWLVKFNSENETRDMFYNLRFLYLNSSGGGISEMGFKSIHPYICLGSIFTNLNMPRGLNNDFFNASHYAGSADRLLAYNIGASLSPKVLRFLKIDFDMYSYADTLSYLRNSSLGSEIDAALTVTPVKNFDLSVIYAKFYPGQGFKDQFLVKYVDVGDITQLAFKAVIKF